MVPTRPPTTTVGSRPAKLRMVAVIEVVVVLPWLPATAMPYFRRINSASSSPRGMTGICRRRASCTSGILFVHRGTDHQRARAGDVGRGVAFEDTRAHGGQALGDGRQFHVAARDLVAQIEQHFRDAAHADASNSGEMKVLGSKEHFLIVLFRLIGQLSIENVAVRPVRPPLKCPRRVRRRRVWRTAGRLRPSASRSAIIRLTVSNSFSPVISASRTRRDAPPRSMAWALRVW